MKSRKIKKRYPWLYDLTMKQYSGDAYIDRQWHDYGQYSNYVKDHVVNIILYILEKSGPITLDRLYALLYFAYREHLVKYASPLFEDVWIAKKEGPRPFYTEFVIQEMKNKKMIEFIK